MINSGLGVTHVNALLSSMNIPTISPRSLKRREREVGKHLEKLAEESCSEVLHEEMEL